VEWIITSKSSLPHLDMDGDDKKENLGFKHSIETLRGKHILTKTTTGLLVILL